MLFNSEEEHKKEILAEQKSRQALVNNLGKEEKKLKTQLASTQEKKKKLDDEISRLMSAEAKENNGFRPEYSARDQSAQ